MSTSTDALLDAALQGQLPNERDALTLATETDTRKLASVAAQLRDERKSALAQQRFLRVQNFGHAVIGNRYFELRIV